MRFPREEKSNASKVPLRLESGSSSCTTLPEESHWIPNHLHGLLELERDHELREVGWYKLDFHFRSAPASVSALVVQNDEKKMTMMWRKRRVWSGFMVNGESCLLQCSQNFWFNEGRGRQEQVRLRLGKGMNCFRVDND